MRAASPLKPLRDLNHLTAVSRRLAVAWSLAAVFVLASAGPSAAQAPAISNDVPPFTPHPQTMRAGALVIAMDNTNQNLVAPFNMKAYGLVNNLLHNNVPLKWVIRTGKAKDGIDFTASAQRIAPTTTATTTYNFKAGPVIVPKTYANYAKTLITAFGNNVEVYELKQDVVVDVHYELRFRPHVWINTTNSAIHVSVMTEAGIPTSDYVVSPDYTILPYECFSVATEPHNGSNTGVPAMRSFIENGGNFIAQCLSVNTYENSPAAGHMMTTLGLVTNNIDNVIGYPNPDAGLSQFEGALEQKPGGSEQDFRLATGSVFQPSAHVLGNDIGASPATYASMGVKLSAGEGGMFFTLGGHNYSGNSNIGYVNGRRILMNAVLTPPARPAGCNLGIPVPDLTVLKFHTGAVARLDTVHYTLQVSNVGDVSTVDTSFVSDTLPAGVSFL